MKFVEKLETRAGVAKRSVESLGSEGLKVKLRPCWCRDLGFRVLGTAILCRVKRSEASAALRSMFWTAGGV